MNVVHKIELDFVQRGMGKRIYAVQGDSGSRMLELSLYAQGCQWPVPEGVEAVLRFQKADGSGGLYDTLPDGTAAWSVLENVITWKLVPQVLSCPGPVTCQLSLMQEEVCLSTFSFDIVVEPDPSLGATESESYFNWSRRFIASPPASVGQLLRVKEVDEAGFPTVWEAMTLPGKLPNPNALTLTGAVEATYDGSEAVSVAIPEGSKYTKIKLWENADPASEFPGQTFSTSGLYSCDAIEILYSIDGGGGDHIASSGMIPVQSDDWGQGYCYYVLSAVMSHDATPYYPIWRKVHFEGGQGATITFDDARCIYTTYQQEVVNNTKIIPLRIYGIEGIE